MKFREESYRVSNWSRREFLSETLLVAAALTAGCGRAAPAAPNGLPLRRRPRTGLKKVLAVVRGTDIPAQVRAAFSALGGLERIISPGMTVLIKPNMSWARRPEQAATTHPEVVGGVVRLCRECRAAKILVLDNTCNNARRSYALSGIAAAARKAGAEVQHLSSADMVRIPLPQPAPFPEWPIARAALEADVIINLPVAKHHSLSRVSLGVKNLMGLIGDDRGDWHKVLPPSLLALQKILVPEVTLLDATRILMNHGPQGGRLDDVRRMNLVAASPDPFAIESFGAEILEAGPDEVPLLTEARKRKLVAPLPRLEESL
ncbi:MAG: DUF362 domain-containing protein [Candidatus Hydrogenedentota bacterium]|nr:MAG: DUF362 domain-containing protein [Candidatus Hydrogenedentota bacterium]